MKNKHYLITGASSGLGEAFAYDLAARGAHLTLAARRLERLKELQKKLMRHFPESKVLVVEVDVSQKNSCATMLEQSVQWFGCLDGLIANAGQSMWSRFRDIKDPDELKHLMELNYMGVVYCAFYALSHLRASMGSFVAISSLQGSIPVPYHSGYVASKFAVNGFIETIRQEEPEVHFLLANPSWIAGTELRSHAVSGVGEHAIKVSTQHKSTVITAKECAHVIVEALIHKKQVLYIPKKYAIVPFARSIAPSFVDMVIKSKVDKQLFPHH